MSLICLLPLLFCFAARGTRKGNSKGQRREGSPEETE